MLIIQNLQPEHKVHIDNIFQQICQHDELRLVIEGNNSESNKRYKFDEVFDEIYIEFCE